MGTNRRYAEQVDRRGDSRHIDRLAAKAPLQTLTRRELELDILPVTTNPRPEKVRAWVRFGPEPCLVDAEVVMWTATACAIRFRTEAKEYRCWVWSTAVQRES
ncbi:hypothetical protein [Microbacterium sp. GXF7504]